MKCSSLLVPSRPSTLLAAMSIAALAPLHTARATDLYWGVDTASSPLWSTASSWFTDAAGTSVSGVAPTSSDDVIFNTTPFNATAVTPRLSAAAAVNSIRFDSTAAVTLLSTSSTARELAIGAGGVTLASGSGAATLGGSSNTIAVRFSANQTWTNNASTLLNIRNNAASATGAGNVVLTLNAAGSGNIQNSGAFSDGSGSTLALVVNSTGTGSVLVANSTYSGGTTIRSGVLQASGASIGSGAVQIGDTSGAANARLTVTGSPSVINNITVASGSSGLKSIAASTSASTVTFQGTITLDDNLLVGTTLNANTNPNVKFIGAVSGTGDLTIGNIGTRTVNFTLGDGVSSVTNTYSGNTTVSAGTFTLADNAVMTFYIDANGVNNQVSGGGANVATFDGDFAFDLTGADLTDGNSWLIVDTSTLNESFSGTFLVQGFTETDNIWTNGAGFSFDEATGVLSYVSTIPEPSTYALLAGSAGLLLAVGRRGRNRPAN